jgi:glucose uptake protein GlcU
MADTLVKTFPKEGIVMDKLMKLHMGIVIGILAFTLGILGFFMVQFVEKVNKMDDKLNSMNDNITVIINDNKWIKESLILLQKK